MKYERECLPKEGKCFVIMPFGKKRFGDRPEPFDWDSHYEEVISNAISKAGMTPIRANEIYGTGTLMEDVWKGIQEAEVVVVDLTGRNPNVLYELGLADVIGKRVILLTMDEQDFPSDLGGYRYIKYTDEGKGLLRFVDELQKNLTAARSEPPREKDLGPLRDSSIEQIKGTVVAVTPKFAIVETDDGRKAFLNPNDVSWTRKFPDLTDRFKEGDRLDGALVPGIRGDLRYSLIAPEENPWHNLESEYPQGRRFIGEVISHPPAVGAFVKLKYKINGLIPKSQIPENAALVVGSEVEAEVIQIDSSHRRVDLRFIRKIAEPKDGWESQYPIGKKLKGTVAHISVQRDYMLVTLPDQSTSILHISNMSENFRSKFERGEFQKGSSLAVEVIAVDKGRERLVLSDSGEEQVD